jgi:hypothetical protein
MSLFNYEKFLLNEVSYYQDKYSKKRGSEKFTLNTTNTEIKPFLDLLIKQGANPDESYQTVDYDPSAPTISYKFGKNEITIEDSTGKRFNLISGKTELKSITYQYKSNDTGGKLDAAKYEQGIVFFYNTEVMGLDEKQAISQGGLDPSVEDWSWRLENTCLPIAKELGNGIGPLIYSGKSKATTSAEWKSNDPTPKTDVYSGKSNGGKFSVKKAGGAQLMSGTAEAKDVFNAALKYYESYEKNTTPLVSPAFIENLSKKVSYVVKSEEGIQKLKANAQEAWVSFRLGAVVDAIRKNNLTLSVAFQKDPNRPATDKAIADAADAHTKAEFAAAGIGDRRGNWETNLIKGIDDGQKVFDNWWTTSYLPTMAEVQKSILLSTILDATQDHREIQESLRNVFQKDPNFLKWLIYEAATGQVKFSGNTNIGSSAGISAIADKFLIFDDRGLAEPISPITVDWAKAHTNKVKTTVGFKSSSGRSASSIRLAIGNTLDENESLQLSGIERIIVEEFSKLNEDMIALNESFIDVFKKTVNSVKTFAAQTWTAITNAISSFYQNVLLRIGEAFKTIFNQGIDAICNFFGFTVEGAVDPIYINF